MQIKRHLYVGLVICLSTITQADTATNPDLKQIMQGLRNDAALVLDGLLVDDLGSVAQAAARIADHPKIPSEQVALVAAELGEEMPAFKRFDTLVHDLSVAVRVAALENDRNRAFAEYHEMIVACIACHASYRQRVADVLSGSASKQPAQ